MLLSVRMASQANILATRNLLKPTLKGHAMRPFKFQASRPREGELRSANRPTSANALVPHFSSPWFKLIFAKLHATADSPFRSLPSSTH